MIEFGLDTFGDVTDREDGTRSTQAQAIRDVVEQAVLADSVGLDVFNVGEHHRDDFAVTAPEVVLAAIAARTERIRLGSAVTVLSSDDPVRVYERFATVDAISDGRAEITLGRGSFTESFPLFGYELSQYETLFSEKLDLFSHLLTEGPITWSGTVRAPLTDQQVYPKTAAGRTPTWGGGGGSREAGVRAARYGLPMLLAIIGVDPRRFAPYVDLYHRALTQLQLPALPVGVHSPGHVAETDAAARDELWRNQKVMWDRIGDERGWPRRGRDDFEDEADHGSLYVGSPETVAQRIAAAVQVLGVQRFDLKYSTGTLPHVSMMRSIQLYGSVVVPRVRELLAEARAQSETATPVPA